MTSDQQDIERPDQEHLAQSSLPRESRKPSFLPRTRHERLLAVGVSVLMVSAIGLVSYQSGLFSSDPARSGGSGFRGASGMGDSIPTNHGRPIVERDDKRLLWARRDPQGDEVEWFDVTESKIDPAAFQYGIGKDTIPAIDDPRFVKADDPRLEEAGINDNTMVIGYAVDGDDARAYPLDILDHHELVNDEVGGKPVTVGW